MRDKKKPKLKKPSFKKHKWVAFASILLAVSLVSSQVLGLNALFDGTSDTSETQSIVNTESSIQNIGSSENSQESENQDASEGELVTNKDEQLDENEVTTFTVSFESSDRGKFNNGESERTIEVEENALVNSEEIPEVEVTAGTGVFTGWQAQDGTIFSNEEISQTEISEDTVYTANIEIQVTAANPQGRAATDSIAGIISSADQSKLVVIPGIGGGSYDADTSNTSTLRNILYGLYVAGDSATDYVIYVGTSITDSTISGKNIFGPKVTGTITGSNIALANLEGKVKSITFVGSSSDPTTSGTQGSSGATTLDLSNGFYCGPDVSFRNIYYNAPNMFANGHSLNLAHGSYNNAATVSIYGGAPSGDINGNPALTIDATGSGDVTIVGGNQVGTLTGNTNTVVNNTSSGGNVTIYGAGYGASTSLMANLDGNATTVVKNLGGALATYYGGTNYGDVSGTISNTISGADVVTGTAQATGGIISGGSFVGNIGIPINQGFASDSVIAAADRTRTVITNSVDTSKYATGERYFNGGTNKSGTIVGNIQTTITLSNNYSSGGLIQLYGVTGKDSDITGISSGNMSQADEMVTYGKATLKNRFFGNVDTNVTKGIAGGPGVKVVGTGINVINATMLIGLYGYSEGDANMTLGQAGWVTNSDGQATVTSGNTAYSKSANTRGYDSGYNIQGGGGISKGNAFVLNGNTHIEAYDVLANWITASVASGYHVGDTATSELYSGIVDTFIGGPALSTKSFITGVSIIHGGQVDNTAAGGTWHSLNDVGDAKTIILGGVINGIVAGIPGYIDSTKLTGNTEVLIKGGDFSGNPRSSLKGKILCGGIGIAGIITGNTKLTIDLRNSTGEKFVLPVGTSISGARPYNDGEGSKIGTNKDNTIELNIFTDNTVDPNLFANATVYGNAGMRNISQTVGHDTMTKSGKITANIDAPGANFGSLAATQYDNLSSGTLYQNVYINLNDAASVAGLSGGSTTEDFVGVSSTTPAVFNVGKGLMVNSSTYETSSTLIPLNEDRMSKRSDILVGGTGVVNFTNLNVGGHRQLIASTGSIKNGAGVVATDTRTNFGNLDLTEGGGIGISASSSAIIYVSTLTVTGECFIQSPGAANKLIINDFIAPTNDDCIVWEKVGSASQLSLAGTWFGTGNVYQVITFKTVANRTKITPLNLRGVDNTTGVTYIGDNALYGGVGYGVTRAGSFVNFKTIGNTNLGKISHNMSNVNIISAGPPSGANVNTIYSTVAKDTPVTSGYLVIPATITDLPTLTFTPDTATGAWIKSLSVTNSNVSGSTISYGEQTTTAALTWTSPSNSYSYAAEVEFTNLSRLSASSIIITNTAAKSVTTEQNIITLNNASGFPFFRNDIAANNTIAVISAGLTTNEVFKKVDVTYSAGDPNIAANIISETVSITVVQDGAIISDDGTTALYAQNSLLTIAQAQALTDISSLNTSYTKAVVIFADGTTQQPTDYSPTDIVDKLKAYTTTGDENVTYKYVTNTNVTLQKTVNLSIVDGYVAKINSTGYTTLESAITDANTQGTSTIQMLVDDYYLPVAQTIKTNITITTANKVGNLPYQGVNDSAEVFFGDSSVSTQPLTSSMFSISSGATLTISNLKVNGNSAQFSKDGGNPQVAPIFNTADGTGRAATGGTLVLDKGTGTNDSTTITGYSGTASVINGDTGTIKLNSGSIKNNYTDEHIIALDNQADLAIQDALIEQNTSVLSGIIISENSTASIVGSASIDNNKINSLISTGRSAIEVDGKLNLGSTPKVFDNFTSDGNDVVANVYLSKENTASSSTYGITIDSQNPLTTGANIGVLTSSDISSADNTGLRGFFIAYASPANSTLDMTEQATYFGHDQLARNENAFAVVFNKSTTDPGLVLGYGSGPLLEFTKVDASKDASGNYVKLEGATFILYEAVDKTTSVPADQQLVTDSTLGVEWTPYLDEGVAKEYVSDSNGLVTVGILPDGEYMLRESEAPTGYELPYGQWYLKVDSSQADMSRIQITAKGDRLPPAFAIDDDTRYLPNMKPLVMPNTGGQGYYGYLLAGVSLMSIASAFIFTYFKKHRV